MTRYASLTDQELVTMAESLPLFQQEGIAREVLLRLAHAAHHPAADSALRKVEQQRGLYSTQRRQGGA